LYGAFTAAVAGRDQRLEAGLPAVLAWIAGRAGFGSAAGLRHHFLRTLGTTPDNAYRRTFRGPLRAARHTRRPRSG
jgi:hypothetical protein